VERESVIRPLAEEEKLTNQCYDWASARRSLKTATAVSTTSARVYQNFVFGLSATRAGSPRFSTYTTRSLPILAGLRTQQAGACESAGMM